MSLEQVGAATGTTVGLVAAAAVIATVGGFGLGVLVAGLGLDPGGRSAWAARLRRVIRSGLGFGLVYPFTVVALVGSVALAGTGWSAIVLPVGLVGLLWYAATTAATLDRVDRATVDSAVAAGADRWRVTRSVLLSEGLPGLVSGAGRAVAALVGYAVLADAVVVAEPTGGGLGALARTLADSTPDPTALGLVAGVVAMLVWLPAAVGSVVARRLTR